VNSAKFVDLLVGRAESRQFLLKGVSLVLRLQNCILSLLLLLATGIMPRPAAGQGILTSASGPINRSMGGAAVAAPLDAIGAIRWNPATLSALPTSELGFGADLIFPLISVDSSIDGLASGSTDSASGVSALPNIGWSHKLDDSPITIGLGMLGIAGFKSNYPASLTNPILFPQSNTPGIPGGFGRIFSSAQFLDLSPTVSIALSDSFSIGISPNLTLGEVVADPLSITAPNDADGSGAPRYPSGRGTQMAWGAGAQIGAYYIVNPAWRIGASLKTPTWMQRFEYQTEDELGRPQVASFHWDLPLIVSTGVSYAGIESTLIALDMRYIDYQSTSGLGDTGFNADGSLRGLGWHGVLGLSLGVQRQITDALIIRGGYTFNQNPIPDELTAVNIGSALHYQHQVALGGSYLLTKNVSLNTAYSFFFPHDITGPIITPAGTIPNSSVTSTESVHVGSMGITVSY